MTSFCRVKHRVEDDDDDDNEGNSGQRDVYKDVLWDF